MEEHDFLVIFNEGREGEEKLDIIAPTQTDALIYAVEILKNRRIERIHVTTVRVI